MLKEICCKEFKKYKITFNEGLNVVLGSPEGDNSIGKSTFLLIIDFVFGGETYSKSTDIIQHVGEHYINFMFVFASEEFRFCRNNFEPNFVWLCNEQYEKQEQWTVSQYTDWLSSKYGIDKLDNLSFRGAVGRYMRIYGKDNCNEKFPLHDFSKEKMPDACFALVKLFDKYGSIAAIRKVADSAKDALSKYKGAQSLQFISNINAKKYKANEVRIKQIDAELATINEAADDRLKDTDTILTDEALRLKNVLSNSCKQRNRLKSRLSKLDLNGNYPFSATIRDFKEFSKFFPNADIKRLSEVESFHRGITRIFKDELDEERKYISEGIKVLDDEITSLDNEFKALLPKSDISRILLTRYAELNKEKQKLESENRSFDKCKGLERYKNESVAKLQESENAIFSEIEKAMNAEMDRLNDEVYDKEFSSPILEFADEKYKFYTPDDTGTGRAYKGLILFDLAVLNLTILPVLIHDTIIFKNLSDYAIRKILTLYQSQQRQIFIAFDKQDSYCDEVRESLKYNSILELGSGGDELFGRAWSRKKTV